MYDPEYSEDGLITWHINSFTKNKLFKSAYQTAFNRRSWKHDNKWRMHVALWASDQVKNIEGDFVECGVNRGGMAAGIIEYIKFEKLNKKFYLFDTYQGIPVKTITDEEKKDGINVKDYGDVYDEVKAYFNKFNNVEVIKGEGPSILSKFILGKICFLSLDMNVPNVEIKTLELLWDKIVKNGIILMDDYCYSKKYRLTLKLFDDFVENKNIKILQLPTGQGLIIKK